MTAKTHDVFAFASLLTVATMFPPVLLKWPTVLVSLVANIVGALLPDLDQASNRLWDLLPGGNAVGKLLRNLFLSHRTISHSLPGVYLIDKLLFRLMPKLINPEFIDVGTVTAAVMIGYVSHLFLDSLTEDGLPLFFPLRWRFGFPPVRSWRIKTGRWFEKLVIFPGIIIYILTLTLFNWRQWWGLIR